MELSLFSRDAQLGAVKRPFPMKAGEAVSKGIIANETLGYFIARTQIFLEKIGINPAKLRFRQHLQHEMAHYAEDCWDAEIESTYGWVECVGLADRSAYDLKAHSDKSNVELTAYEKYAEPVMEEQLVVEPNKKDMGKAFKKDAKAVTDALLALCKEDAFALKAKVEAEGKATIATEAGEGGDPPRYGAHRDGDEEGVRAPVHALCDRALLRRRSHHVLHVRAQLLYVRPDDEQKTVFKFSPSSRPSSAPSSRSSATQG